jgi:hypothetical protein
MSLTLVPGSGVSRIVPDTVRALLSLPRVDYADRYVLATAANAAPERWARTMFGDVPTLAERFIWRGVLGLRLHRGPSPEVVGGWRIGGRGADWIRLEAESWFLQANMLVQTGDGQVSWTTALRYVRPLADVVWPPASALHRRLVPRVLSAAARRLR